MSRELKPCPFCGVGVQNTDDSDKYPRLFYRGGYYVECECCGAYLVQTNKYKGPGWNTRPIEDALNTRIAELEAAQKEALSLLPELERGHYYCDDCWYSCPKAVDGCCDESRGDECDCGADDYNALLAKIIGLLTPEVQK